MSLEENKAIVRKLTEDFNTRNLKALYESIAPNVVLYTNALQMHGLEEYKRFIAMFLKSFPDYRDSIEDVIAEDHQVWVRAIVTGTHTGEFRGSAPTNKKFTEPHVHIYRIVNGKVVECWAVVDELDFLKQRGAIEITEQGKHLFPDEKVLP